MDTLNINNEFLSSEKNSKKLNLKIDNPLIDTLHTAVATLLGEAILSGDFDKFSSFLNEDAEVVIYDDRTISGKANVIDYWNGWRERWVIIDKVSKFEVKHSNYYFRSCLILETMVVLFYFTDNMISKMAIVRSHISGGVYTHHDDLINDYPFKLNYIKKYIVQCNEAEENEKPSVKKHRLPCFSCGNSSETLDWYNSDILIGLHGYLGEVSICHKCGKVVEYVTNTRYRVENPVNENVQENIEQEALQIYADCWNEKYIGIFDVCLSENFHYSSFWVCEELDKKGYLNYLEGKLNTLEKSQSEVTAKVQGNLIVVTQDNKNYVIDVKFEKELIVSAYMAPASFYGLPDEERKQRKFDLWGVRSFYGSTPLKGTKYVTFSKEDAIKYGSRFIAERLKVKDIAEKWDWIYLGQLARNNHEYLDLVKSCCESAINDGLYEVANNLGVLAYNYENNIEEGLKWLRYAASKGSQNAMINLFTIHWTNDDFSEAIKTLEDNRNLNKPSLMCLWNLAYLYYFGYDCNDYILEENQSLAKEILNSIINIDNSEIECENDVDVPSIAQEFLDYIETTNVYEHIGKEYHNLLNKRIVKYYQIKDKNEVFTILNYLSLDEGTHLGLRIAEEQTELMGDESNFYIYDNFGKEELDIIKYIRVKPSKMSAWQVYLLMTSPTVMPVFWHGEYSVRKFIFKESDLDSIEQLANSDLSSLLKLNLIQPSVVIEQETDPNKFIAHVYCCYWNDWKGLVREHAKIEFEDNKILSYNVEDEFIFFKYHSRIFF